MACTPTAVVLRTELPRTLMDSSLISLRRPEWPYGTQAMACTPTSVVLRTELTRTLMDNPLVTTVNIERRRERLFCTHARASSTAHKGSRSWKSPRWLRQ
mmetsp:Transcript_47584/g.115876  ORF Transcript_47584/g.115876 Transcript_47584/m.115876 type:complete len:100 (-) Transcript_47584:360-659(-)